jgi:PIN domain nuclease of toxin-antitoxin system
LQKEGVSPQDFPHVCLNIGFDIEDLAADSSTYHQLAATDHKDPFDRMLIWQAIRNDYILISVDANVRKYASEGLKVLVTA